MALRIQMNGDIKALSGSGAEEALDLRSFGHLSARRAGRVFFNEKTQRWDWCASAGICGGGGFLTRAEAVRNEVETLMGRL